MYTNIFLYYACICRLPTIETMSFTGYIINNIKICVNNHNICIPIGIPIHYSDLTINILTKYNKLKYLL